MEKAIYKITNVVNGKMYIGQSMYPNHRFVSHLSRAKHGEGSGRHSALHSAMNEYGAENFVMEVLEWTDDYDNREMELIQQYNTLVPNGYNIISGGKELPHLYGEDHPKSVITNEEVNWVICLLKYSDMTESEIGRWFKKQFNPEMVGSINHGTTHRRARQKYPIRMESPYHLNDMEVDEIKWLLKNTQYTTLQIARYYDVNKSVISHINTGRTHRCDDEVYPIRTSKSSGQSQPVETILAKRSTGAIDTHPETGVCAKSV